MPDLPTLRSTIGRARRRSTELRPRSTTLGRTLCAHETTLERHWTNILRTSRSTQVLEIIQCRIRSISPNLADQQKQFQNQSQIQFQKQKGDLRARARMRKERPRSMMRISEIPKAAGYFRQPRLNNPRHRTEPTREATQTPFPRYLVDPTPDRPKKGQLRGVKTKALNNPSIWQTQP